MLKKITCLLIVVALLSIVISFRQKFYGFQPPSNYSGAPDGVGLCSDCHGNLNTGGGSVVINGLPATFQAGKTYPFSVTISHPSERGRWGFEINARNATGNPVGSFASANPNAAINGGPAEIAHYGAVNAVGTSYTYANLSWTAPATIAAGDNQVRFYIAGNAANGNDSNTGDFIYTNTTLFVLPVTLKAFECKVTEKGKVRLQWTTASESNSREFVIERSEDNQQFSEAGHVAAAGNSNTDKTYSFLDEQPFSNGFTVYYGLKQVDWDGSSQYSKTVKAVSRSKGFFVNAFYPNPASGFLNLDVVADISAKATISILTATGKLAGKQILSIEKGKKVYRLTLPVLQRGAYFLRLQAGSYTQTIAFTSL